MTENTVTPRHPLLDIQPLRLQTWEDWLSRWSDPQLSHQERLGLLHAGWTVKAPFYADQGEQDGQRICFYLQVADHYLENVDSFRAPGDAEPSTGLDRDEMDQLRLELAQKAFQVLAQSFFKAGSGSYERRQAFQLATRPEVLTAILGFFRLNTTYVHPMLENLYTPDNIGRSAHQQWAHQFLLELCDYFWNIRPYLYRGPAPEAIRQQCSRVLDLLCGLRRLNLLTEDAHIAGKVDDASSRRLEELAMTERYLPDATGYSDEKRAPHSLDEAVASGSQAALVLYQLRVKQQMSEHVAELRRASQE